MPSKMENLVKDVVKEPFTATVGSNDGVHEIVLTHPDYPSNGTVEYLPEKLGTPGYWAAKIQELMGLMTHMADPKNQESQRQYLKDEAAGVFLKDSGEPLPPLPDWLA